MARKVYISSDISTDEAVSEIAEIDPVIALLWPWFLTYFDDWGRARANPREIKNSIFQANTLVTIELIKKALQLFSPKLIRLYQVNEKWFMCVDSDKWFKYQTHIRKEKRENDSSKIPPPPSDNSAQVREDARDNAEVIANLADCIPSPSLSPSPSPPLGSSGGSENPFKLFESEGFGTLSQGIGQKIGYFIDDYTERWVCEAMKEASYQGKRTLSYVDGILKRWKAEGIDSPWTKEKEEKPKQYNNKVSPINKLQEMYKKAEEDERREANGGY